MTRRERNLVVVFGVGAGAVVLYGALNLLFLTPYREATEMLEELRADRREMQGIIDSRELLARQWLNNAERTFSFNRPEALDRFGQQLKDLAVQHGFGSANFSISAGTKIGNKTDITTVAHRISAEGSYDQAMDFLRDVYRTPYLTQVTRLTMSPLDTKGPGRNRVKLDVTVESPLLPEVESEEIPEVQTVRTMPDDIEPAELGPARGDQVRPDAYFALLEDRNLFRAYMPPPPTMVRVDNQDWKTVMVKAKFLWDGKVVEQPVESVAGKSEKTISGKGNVLEIEAFYADGEAYGPKRMEAQGNAPWSFLVPAHHPPPSPKVVDLAVNNQSGETVDVAVELTTEDGEKVTRPTMRFPAGQHDVDRYEVASVEVSATYASGATARSQTFRPSETKQTYVIKPEPKANEPTQAPPVVRSDPPPDASLRVSGTWTYTDRTGEFKQELMASSPQARTVISAGEEGAMDGGTLIAIHPLGGIVEMPSNNFYLYPVGKRFSERVQLDARDREELPRAIDAAAEQFVVAVPQ